MTHADNTIEPAMVGNETMAKIAKVIVLEDRAQIFRRCTVTLQPGTQRLRFPSVTPLLSDRSLNARLSPADEKSDASIKIQNSAKSVRLDRAWQGVSANRGSQYDALVEEAQTWLRKNAAHERQTQLIQTQSNWLSSIRDLSIDGLNRELKQGGSFLERWPSMLLRLQDQVEQQAKVEQAHEQAANTLRLEHAHLAARRQALSSHELLARSTIEAVFEVERAGAYECEVSYVVPCAAWRPMHRAIALEKEVTIESACALWQATGEDWNNVELWVSTARPTRPASPPDLPIDRIQKRDKQEQKTAVAIRETTIQTTGAGGAGSGGEDGGNDGMNDGGVNDTGVNDGGETRLMRAEGAVTVPSDGKMRRSELFKFTAPASWQLVCRAELDETVHPICTTENRSTFPLLAGPIDLIGQAGYVGRTELDYTAPNEKLELDLGNNHALRIRREVDEERETARLSGKQTIKRKVRLFLSNLDQRSYTFILEERVLVSELTEVTVEINDTKDFGQQKPDSNGMMRHQVKMQPSSTTECGFSYTITASGNVQGL